MIKLLMRTIPWKIVVLCIVFMYAFLTIGGLHQEVSAQDGPALNLPSDTATLVLEHPPLGPPDSYFHSTLSGIAPDFDVTNGVYPGWCSTAFIGINTNESFTVSFFSSYDPGLPACQKTCGDGTQTIDWPRVNYVLNHKHLKAHWPDVQTAIAQLCEENPGYVEDGPLAGECSISKKPCTPKNPLEKSNCPENSDICLFVASIMRDDAINNGIGFVPDRGEVVAVIADIVNDDGTSRCGNVVDDLQHQFIEVKVPNCPEVTKKCCILPPPPPPVPFVCSDAKPINELTMKWNGTQAIKVVAHKGDTNAEIVETVDDIEPGQVVTISGFAGSPNDIIWEIFLAGTNTKIGESTFHLSCSDDNMNGPEDCGNPEGDGKGKTGFLNLWIFGGMAGNGMALVCKGFEPEVPTPTTCKIPPPGPFACDKAKPIDELTMRWSPKTGSMYDVNIKVAAHKGDLNAEIVATVDNITPGQVVTISGFAGSPNDIIWEIFEADTNDKIGYSTFHLSCSDDNMNGLDDCGKPEGDGKDKTGFLNLWSFGGMAGNSMALVCPGFELEVPPTETCEFTPPPPPPFVCSDAKPIDKLSMRWNDIQNIKVVAHKGDLNAEIVATVDNITPGQVVTISGFAGSPNDIIWEIFKAGTDNKIGDSTFHLSCSDDNMNGPEDCKKPEGDGKGKTGFLNDWIFEGMGGNGLGFDCSNLDGSGAGADVLYFYTITNPGTSPIEVTKAFDDKLSKNILALPRTLNPRQSVDVTIQAFVVPDATNELTNTIMVEADGATCKATAQATVKRLPPPPAPFVCSDTKPIDSLSMIWNGPEGMKVNVEAHKGMNESDPIVGTQEVNRGGMVVFNGFGGKSDVMWEIFDAVTGAKLSKSTFHLSCSDVDMNGPEDCGKPEGDGKNKAGFVNLWLFAGMEGKSKLECATFDLPPAPPLPGSTGKVEGNIFGPTVTDHRLYWNLTNNGQTMATITRVDVTWPTVSGKLKKLLLDGDVFADPPDILPTAATIETFASDVGKRQITPGETRQFKIEFEKNSWVDTASDYTIVITFDSGSTVSWKP